MELRERTKDYPFLESAGTESFLINLADEIHYRPLTFATLAHHLAEQKNDEKNKAKTSAGLKWLVIRGFPE